MLVLWLVAHNVGRSQGIKKYRHILQALLDRTEDPEEEQHYLERLNTPNQLLLQKVANDRIYIPPNRKNK